ncbi:MAG: hypothetical protein LBH29_01330 [Elusimicrobiota bacterium]|nr:hypothetical protein [Elusimicrobiota bacterium]
MINIKNCIFTLLLILCMALFASHSQGDLGLEQNYNENSADGSPLKSDSIFLINYGLYHIFGNAGIGFSYCYNSCPKQPHYPADSPYSGYAVKEYNVYGNLAEFFKIEDSFKEVREISFLFDDIFKGEDEQSLYMWNENSFGAFSGGY